MRGATGRVLRDLARAMAREGWQVSVITTGPKASRSKEDGVRVIRVPSVSKPRSVIGSLTLWRRMAKAARKVEVADLVVSMTDPPFQILIGSAVQKRLGARHIHWCQDLYPDLLPCLGIGVPSFVLSFLKRKTMAAMAKCERVIVIGRCMAKRLNEDGQASDNITVVPNWPDIELVSPYGKEGFNVSSRDKGGGLDEEFCEGDDIAAYRPAASQIKHGPKFRVLYAGNLGLAHPVETLIGAAALLKEEHPEVEFAFVGDGPVFDEVAQRRDVEGLSNIRLLPYQPLGRLRTIMESGDVHVISMQQDAAGLLAPCKLYAALAVGRPSVFIGPSQSETAKVLQDYKAGRVVPQGDARTLADAILYYRQNGDAWFSAHHAALEAGKIFLPKASMDAWIERAWATIESDIREAA